MILPVLVYAARDGYGWISGEKISQRHSLRRLCGKTPDVSNRQIHSGVVLAGDTVVVFRFMLERKADTKGRDGVYHVFTFFPRTEAALIDLDVLFSQPVFSGPIHFPPAEFEYTGGPARECSGLYSVGKDCWVWNEEGVWGNIGAAAATQSFGPCKEMSWRNDGISKRILCRILRPEDSVPVASKANPVVLESIPVDPKPISGPEQTERARFFVSRLNRVTALLPFLLGCSILLSLFIGWWCCQIFKRCHVEQGLRQMISQPISVFNDEGRKTDQVNWFLPLFYQQIFKWESLVRKEPDIHVDSLQE